MNYIEVLITWICISVIFFSSAVFGQSAEELYQKGVQYEEIKGDLDKAIESYNAVLKKENSTRKTAALALLHLGICYEKLGKEKLDNAVESFQKVISEYPEQHAQVKIAKEKLASHDTSKDDIEEIKKTLADYYSAFESKNAETVTNFFTKDFYDNQLWGKSTGDPDKEFQDWLISNYFSKWQKIRMDYTVKSIDKSGFNYLLREDHDVYVTDWNNREIILERSADAYLTFSKENGKWKISAFGTKKNLPEAYRDKEIFKSRGNTGLVYVSHITQNFVTVIDPTTNKVVDQIPSRQGSTSVSLAPDTNLGFITNYFSNNVTVFNKKTSWEINVIDAGEHPSNSMFTPSGKYLLVMHESNSGMWKIDPWKNQVINKSFDVTGNMTMHPSGNRIYAPAVFKPVIYVLGDSSMKEFYVGGLPMNIEFTPDGNYAYVTNYDLNEVEVIDCRVDSVIKRIQNIDHPRGIAISLDDKYAYITNVNVNTVTILDLKNNSVLKTLTVGKMPTSAAVSKDNKYVYVTNHEAASVTVIDVGKNEVIQTIELADNPITVQVE